MTIDNDHEPTIEACAITLLELLEFMGDLGPSPGVIAGRYVRKEWCPGNLFDSASPEIQDAMMQLLRATSKKRRRRSAMGLTLEQLAERAALAPNYIGTIENGRRDPSLSEVIAITRGFDVARAEPFEAVPDLTASAEASGELFTPAPPEIQKAVLALLRSVSTKRKPPAPPNGE